MQAKALYFAESENSSPKIQSSIIIEEKCIHVETIGCPEKFKSKFSNSTPELAILEIMAKAESRGRFLLKWLSQQKKFENTIVICENISEILDLLRMGAKSVVPKGNAEYLNTAVADVSNGYTYLPESLGPELARQIQSEYVPQRIRTMWGRLSKREMDILNCYNQGLCNKDIASMLGVSPKTLQNQITTLLKKLNFSSLKKAAEFFPKIIYLEYGNFL